MGQKNDRQYVIGVTGHRHLCPGETEAIRRAVLECLRQQMEEHPHRTAVMLNSLAAGADLLCAEAALELGVELVCPLPMAVEEYAQDFSPPDLALYRQMLEAAKEVFVVPKLEPLQPGREYRYRQAGVYIAQNSDVLLAVWDGEERKPDGCGTDAVVHYALHGSRWAPAPKLKEILHVRADREGVAPARPVSVARITAPKGSAEGKTT